MNCVFMLNEEREVLNNFEEGKVGKVFYVFVTHAR